MGIVEQMGKVAQVGMAAKVGVISASQWEVFQVSVIAQKEIFQVGAIEA